MRITSQYLYTKFSPLQVVNFCGPGKLNLGIRTFVGSKTIRSTGNKSKPSSFGEDWDRRKYKDRHVVDQHSRFSPSPGATQTRKQSNSPGSENVEMWTYSDRSPKEFHFEMFGLVASCSINFDSRPPKNGKEMMNVWKLSFLFYF